MLGLARTLQNSSVSSAIGRPPVTDTGQAPSNRVGAKPVGSNDLFVFSGYHKGVKNDRFCPKHFSYRWRIVQYEVVGSAREAVLLPVVAEAGLLEAETDDTQAWESGCARGTGLRVVDWHYASFPSVRWV